MRKLSPEVQQKLRRLRAALNYGTRRGWPVFPVPPGTKKSYKSAARSNGRRWGASTDPDEVEGDFWYRWPDANVGIATGAESRIFVVETDTPEGHNVDGEASLRKLEAQHGPLPETLMAISPSGSKHYYFRHPGGGIWISNSVGERGGGLGPGIDVRGDGGIMIAPPSVKPGVGEYRWLNDLPIADAPAWLIERTTKQKVAKKPKIKKAKAKVQQPRVIAPSISSKPDALQELADACAELAAEEEGSRNDALNRHAFFLGQLVGAERLDEETAREHLAEAARDCGLEEHEIAATIESGIEAGKLQPRELIAEAWRAHRENQSVIPLWSAAAARRQIKRLVQTFLDSTAVDRVHALRATTGIGKTQIAIELISKWLQADPKRTVLYVVPYHDLGKDIVRYFAKHGISARVYRGREAPDPEQPGQKMCLNLLQVEVAIACGKNVPKTCCWHKKRDGTEQICDDYHRCGWQAQLLLPPRVWVVAANLLFVAQQALGEPSLVVVDENFWQAGLRKFEHPRTHQLKPLPLGAIRHHDHRLHALRAKLARALQVQTENIKPNDLVPVRRSAIERVLSIEDCEQARTAEYAALPHPRLYPGMPEHALGRIPDMAVKQARQIIAIWVEVKNMLTADIAVSGRLWLTLDGGAPAVQLNTVAPINGQWAAPTLLMDATLPGLPILRTFYPDVDVVGDLNVAAPHAYVRQVLKAPTTAKALTLEENRQDVLNYILRRWHECRCCRTLVVAQKPYADWLREPGRLPRGVEVLHFNKLVGSDDFSDVGLEIVVGRTEPTPLSMEMDAGALSGRAPELVLGPGNWWYPRHDVEIARGVVLRCGYHPDLLVEAHRWQACESGLVQAIGRARAVNRTALGRVEIDVLADVFMPVALDAVAYWPPRAVVVMVWSGLVLRSQRDMVRVWPEVWPNESAAKRALKSLRNFVKSGSLSIEDTLKEMTHSSSHVRNSGFRRFSYRPDGVKQRWREGFYDPALMSDPRQLLRTKLGAETQFLM